VLHTRSYLSLKHSDRGSCRSIQQSCGPINGGPNATTVGVYKLPSLTSYTPLEEPDTNEIGIEISNSLGQDVDFYVKIHKQKQCTIVDEDITITLHMYILLSSVLN